MALSDVTLIDGTIVRSDSDAWRAECEARGVLRMRDKYKRREWLRLVAMKRGQANADKLQADVMDLWRHENKD